MQADWGGRPVSRRRFLGQWLSLAVLLAGGSLVGAAAGRAARTYYAERSLAGLDQNAEAFDALRGGTPEPAVFAATGDASWQQPPPELMPTRLLIPSIRLDAPVVPIGVREENGEKVWETASHAVGFHLGTAPPGYGGNTVLSGHISSPVRGEGDIFRHLPDVKPGDMVTVMTGDGRSTRYVIRGTMVVTPEDTWVMNQTPDQTLTLITCVPDGVYTHRFVATAKREGGAAEAAAGG